MSADITGQAIKVFQCPACKEYINTSMRECRFCGSPVDYETALAGTIAREKIDRVCDRAETIHTVVWLMPLVFWAAGMFVYINWSDLFIRPLGFMLLPVIALVMIVVWWLKARQIHAEDPDLERAKRRLKVAFWVWVLTFPVPLIVIFLARISIWK